MTNRRNIMFGISALLVAVAAFTAFGAGLSENAPRILLAAALVVAVIYFAFSGRGKVNVKESFFVNDAGNAKSAVTFGDVAANEEAVKSLKEISEYIHHPEKYSRLGARMPRGVLLYGPPGTGKTLLARALAGEAGVPIFAINGSDFVQMYAGVGASRVRALFKKARKCGKCVVFIDEIDAVGKKRRDESSDERDQTLNALLSEMSGFSPTDGVVVVAATNRIDTLDDALLRPGRFDRRIEVALPSRDERSDILKLHLKNKRAATDIDVQTIAAQTATFSGASLETMVNEAAIRAASRGADEIAQDDLTTAFITTLAGSDKKSVASRKELAIIALHESGHALISKIKLPDDRVTRVTILPTSKGFAGYSLSIPPEMGVVDKQRLLAQIDVLLAGRAAEMLIGGENALTGGAANDLERASETACKMVMDLGMVFKPCLSVRQLHKSTGVSFPEALSAAKELLEREFDEVTKLLSDNVTTLMALSQALMERETIDEKELDEIVSPKREPA